MTKTKSVTSVLLPVFVTVLSSLLIAGCGSEKTKKPADAVAVDTENLQPGTAGKLREVTFLPYWIPTAQFAGYYVAKEKGIYEKYGIRMNFITYRPFVTSTGLIASGEADFAALWLANAIELKATGTDIVNIAQPSFRSSAMLITKKKSGISTIRAMDGKRAGIWSGYELLPKAFFNKFNVNVTIIPIGSTNTLFLMDGVDITIANWFDEYHSIINSGYDPDELNVFFFADYGLNFLEDGIYCLNNKRTSDPGLCSDFVKATLEGWRYAFSHKEEAIDIVLDYARKNKFPANRIHQLWMLDRYRDLYLPEGKKDFNHILRENDYLFVANILKNDSLIREVPPFENFYQPVIK